MTTEGFVDHMAKLLARIDTVAPSDASVVLSGESGTESEAVARASMQSL